METGTTLDAGAAVDAQPDAPELEAQEVEGNAQPAKAGGIPKAKKAETLSKLLKREKENPNATFNDAELDVLDEHYAGKLEPAKKTKGQAPAPEKEETPIAEPGDETDDEVAETDEEDADEAPEESDDDDSNPELEALMKEVGAKNPKELLAKVKELRKKTGGLDAQTVATLKREKDDFIKSHSNLMADAKSGKPEALDFFERTFGLKVVPVGQQAAQGQQQPKAQGTARINRDLFVDEESADMVNQAFEALEGRISKFESTAQGFEAERQRIQRTSAQESARNATVDEMVQVAQEIETLKGVNGLREAIASWYDGKPDSRLDSFAELFDLAKENGTNLRAALLIKRGKEANLREAKARQEGRKDAYSHKPNPSLSGSQGGKGEGNYQPLTDAQIEAMETDHTLMPKSWFDKDENPDLSKIPKKAHRLFA